MATLALTPVELYLRTNYEPDADYVDGLIEERPVPKWDHASWQQAIQLWFVQNQSRWGIRVRAEVRVQTQTTRFRIPDVVVTDRSRPIEQILTHPPIAVFEILSPEDRMPRMMRKLDDYARMGVANILVIDLENNFHRYSESRLVPLAGLIEPLQGTEAVLDVSAIRELGEL